ncbi:low temperature requirement protein A [Micromonospora humidisoli]|uniref:Low temperature requirement protein A n=1 Tax=Micromonospora humidisoli TaxID=2807622 RepID=A0ABS2JEV8_9ACTN|nr:MULTISPECIES: low temperature requirement protein A [Micromonospora]MBM7084106.1 low temperature requirement protein A [Micromonospora humidisoli]GHJ06662.1 low temperature requirement protein A [Micromonospora sp. AKA109]
MGGPTSWHGVRPGAPGSRTTRLELFYDLVFVFAFFTVTALTSQEPTGVNLLRCLLVLGLLWWCWTGFAGLGNAVRADQGPLPLLGFLTVTATFLLALSMPGAFVDEPGGLDGPLVFAGCYLLVRACQLAVFGVLARGDPDRWRRWTRLALLPVAATALLVASALLTRRVATEGTATALQLTLWTLALLLEYVAGVRLGGTYWAVLSAGHWAERHALMVLIALGESIIALGVGPKFVTGLPLTWPVVIAAVLGIAIASVLWWAYFDTLALALEQALHRSRDPVRRARLARDAYTYLHLPIIAGVIFFALGLKDLLAEVADPDTPLWGVPLGGYWVLVLYGGVGLYLLSLVACELRAARVLRWPPVLAVLALAALAPAGARVPEVGALALLALVCVALAAVQTSGQGRRRRRVRRLALAQEEAVEEAQSRWRREHL